MVQTRLEKVKATFLMDDILESIIKKLEVFYHTKCYKKKGIR